MSGEELKSIPKPIIGIQGVIVEDGIGDLSHILNAGKRLEAKGYSIVYRIQWGKSNTAEFERLRLKLLADKLYYHKLIPFIPEIFQEEKASAQQLIEEIKAVSNPNLHINLKDEDFDKQFQHIPLWVDVSFISGYKPRGESRFLWAEHNSHDWICECSSRKVPIQNIHIMGFGSIDQWLLNLTGYKDKKVECEGIFLEDHLTKTLDSRGELLSNIRHIDFHRFLHGADDIDLKAARSIVGRTAFVPCYFLRDKEQALQTVVVSCAHAFEDAKWDQVFLKGNFTDEELFTEANLSILKAKGFTSVEYYDAKSGKKKTYSLKLEDRPSKVLKLLSGAYFSESDHICITQLGSEIVGCSGDNSLQEAISNGAVPIFQWHFPNKAKTLGNLCGILQAHPKASEWNLCIEYLKIYQSYCKAAEDSKLSAEEHKQARERPFKVIPQHITPALITQWKEVGAYLVEHHNAYNGLCASVAEALARPPVIPVVNPDAFFQPGGDKAKEKTDAVSQTPKPSGGCSIS